MRVTRKTTQKLKVTKLLHIISDQELTLNDSLFKLWLKRQETY